jgi:hypothetical protein
VVALHKYSTCRTAGPETSEEIEAEECVQQVEKEINTGEKSDDE